MRHAGAALSSMVLLLAGCGDGGTGPDDDPLASVEVDALMGTLGESTMGLDPDLFEVDADRHFTFEQPCPQGGSMTGSGSVAEGESANELGLELSMRYRSCGHASEVGTFELNGVLDEVGTFTFDETLETFSFQLSLEGRFDWRLDDRAGACEIDVEVSARDDGELTVSGTICGEPASLGP